MINTAIAVGLANFIFIFLKAFQQRNVAFMHYGWVVPTSLLMAVAEVYVVGAVAVNAVAVGLSPALVPFILAVGLGGGLGAVCSMWLHKRIMREKHADLRNTVPEVRPSMGRIVSLRGSSTAMSEVRTPGDTEKD